MEQPNFEDYRPLLFGIAYRMLGSVMEAEDIVQEVYLRYQATMTPITHPKAYLSTITTRLCLDKLKSAQTQRETYIGTWLPEPLVMQEENAFKKVLEMESVSMAFLVLLERLTPPERAVFLLREVFDYDYGEIATMLEREESACRQLFHRAKQHLTENRPRFTSTPEEQQTVIGQFMQACSTGDLGGLMTILAEDVRSYSDGGGKAKAAVRTIIGREAVARLMLGLVKQAPANVRVEARIINGAWGLVYYEGEKLLLVLLPEIGNGQVQNLRFILNPDKLQHLQQ